MADWLEQYSAALVERDAREQAHKPYIDAYTELADRTAALAASSSSPQPVDPPQPGTPTKGKGAAVKDASEQTSGDLMARLRADLAMTQKARATLQSQVEGLTISVAALQTQSKTSTTQLAQMTKQKAELVRKLRDRDEELRGKSRMVEQAQDEMVALGLQLSMAEAKSEKLTQENNELVERWMKRMSEEAETMNRTSQWE